ncbi:MAG: zinc-ribbon domain-containing protein [Candidatus Colwellbacteria bacterium]|nr:zinc-ribbon domain-containing protein [Candidatus Colwellbacteria bacterium]
MEVTLQKQCPKCKTEVSETAYFCSNCGQPLKSRPESTSIPKQILIYFVSFFLAPLGLVYTFKYLRQPDKKSKTIGAVSLALTIVAITATVYLGIAYTKQQYSEINSLLNGGL